MTANRLYPRIIKHLLVLLFAVILNFTTYAQFCDPTVPSFTVDLSASPDVAWISSDTVREGLCCGNTDPDNCIEFVVTLHPDAQGILFDIYDGAIPPGALYYQIDCGTIQEVGQPICLNGAGPYTITFCKPGKNVNKYIIRQIPPPGVGPGQVINDGCNGMFYAFGYQDTSLTWTSIYPGPQGAYDSYLSCTTGCDTTYVSAQAGYPPYVDFMVCGIPGAACDTVPECDTVRAYFNSTLRVDITPLNPTICYGGLPETLTATGSGGTPPYSYQWNTGATTQSISVSTPGTYIVTMSDTSDCPPVYDTVVVTQFTQPIEAQAGPDQSICVQPPIANLSGNIIAASGGTWVGGTGTFSPHRDSLTATYTPSVTEVSNGSVELYLVTTGNGTCPADTDTIVLAFNSFAAGLAVLETDITCNGAQDGAAEVLITGGSGPYDITWNTVPVQNGDSATGLAGGSYDVTIVDANGCDTTMPFAIDEPTALTTTTSVTNVNCHGGQDGRATVTVTGGSPNYTYVWDSQAGSQTGSSVLNLPAGSYGVTITDNNGCVINETVTITEPDSIVVQVTAGDTLCVGTQRTLTAIAAGGNGGYTFTWNPGGFDGQSVKVTPQTTTTYTLTVVDSLGCTTKQKTTTYHVRNLAEDTILLSKLGDICQGEGTDITAYHQGTYPPYTYSWHPNLGGGPGTYTVTPTQTTTYSLTVTDVCGTSITDTIVVNVNPKPTALFNAPNVCEFLEAQLSDSSQGGVISWLWDFGDGSFASAEQNPTHAYNTAGFYDVTLYVQTDYCKDSITQTIEVYDTPIAIFNADPTTLSVLQPTVYLEDLSVGAEYGNWDFGDGDSAAYLKGKTAEHVYPAENIPGGNSFTVTLSVMNEFGCVDTAMQDIVVNPYFTFYIPNAFTPNGDLNNETFFAQGVGILEYEMWIYDRWGNETFHCQVDDVPQSQICHWNGVPDFFTTEEIAQQDVYVWKVVFKDFMYEEHKMMGHVTLIR